MMGPLTTSSFRSTLIAGALLALSSTAPALAVTTTVYWDRADYGFGAGIGTSAGVTTSGLEVKSAVNTELKPNPLLLTDTLNQNFVPANPALVSQQWIATNNVDGLNDGNENQTLYLVFVRPTTSTLELDGVTHDITYDPADVGLTISFGEGGADWVIFQTIATTGDTVYLPAVSLGTLENGAVRDFSISYSLKNPQVFQGDSITKLGVPKWDLAFITRPAAPIPEPTSGLLMMLGLLGISRVRRKRS